jgi:non-specific serine/threonine protein kinase
VELAPVSDPSLLPATVVATLGLQEEQGRTPLDVLTEFLHAKSVLLVLDNCEHLIEPSAQLADTLLRAAPALTILATSRESLGIAGETAFRVPSLPLPDIGAGVELGRAAANDCVRLFVDRARAADPRFHLTERNAAAISQICLRLDGIPLAIELAAARIKVFSPDQIEARLHDRFRLLTGGSRTALERHQTLQALIDWSYDLLSEDERIVLRRLSVFAGGWSLEAAQAVCGAEADRSATDEEAIAADVVDTLARLADKSLVTVDESAESVEARYRLLETIRQYGRDKLLAAAESELIRDRHLDFLLGLVEDAEPRLRGADQLAWLERLETEHDNLRAALGWAIERRDAERALRLTGAAAYFWELRGYWSEGHRWLEEGIALSSRGGARPPRDVHAAARAKALYGAARLRFAYRIEPPASRVIAEESLGLWRALDDRWWMATALEHVGFMLMWENDLPTARARLEEGVSLARDVEDHWPLAMCLSRLSGALGPTDPAGAQQIREEAVEVARGVGDQSVLSQALVGLAFMKVMSGNLPTAAQMAAEALAAARAIRSVTQIFLSLLVSSVVTGLRGDAAAARSYCLELFALARDTGSTIVQLVGVLASGFAACLSESPERGVLLLTALERFGGERGVRESSVRGIFQSLFKLSLDRARTQLDPAAFDAAIREGSTLTLEQAVQLATAD